MRISGTPGAAQKRSSLRFIALIAGSMSMIASGTIFLVASVIVTPGAMQLTVTLYWPSWPARNFVSPTTPHLVWLYVNAPTSWNSATGAMLYKYAAPDDWLMMRPQLCSTIVGAQAFAMSQAPWRFTLKTLCRYS